MRSFPITPFLMRILLALLLAVNGIGPALAAGTLHHGAAPASEAGGQAMPTAATEADCHDDDVAAASPTTPMPAPCCEDGRCDLLGCECSCLAVAAALPVPSPGVVAFVPASRPERVPVRAHAPPPRGTMIRPPIA